MPYRGILAYQKLKKQTYPLFLKLLWIPSQKNQSAEIKTTYALLGKTRFISWLEKTKKFYRSQYPNALPFKVGLIPIPDKDLVIGEKNTSATSLRDAQIVPYLMSEGVRDSLDVIFHEFCHALYVGQPDTVKNDINDFYIQSEDSHAVFVYRYFNEILATAWGNGWYSEILNGKPYEKSWYNVPYIDHLARAILPLIKSYVHEGKPLDRSFMENTLELAKTKFPNGPREIDPNFLAVHLLIDESVENPNDIKHTLMKTFRVQSFHKSSPMTEEDLSQIVNRDLKNYIVVTNNPDQGFKKINKYLDLSSIEKSIKGQNTFWVILPKDNHYFFWANVKNTSQFLELLERIKKLKILPNQPTVLIK